MKNLPPSGLSGQEVCRAKRRYREKRIPKRDGSQRVINAPDDTTKAAQESILHWMEKRYTPHNSVHGFTKERGVRTAAVAAAHMAASVRRPDKFIAISVDLKDFFPGVKLGDVKRLLRSMGATREEAQDMGYWATHKGVLPQGSPCSPIIANAMADGLDKALQGLAGSREGIYLRYADDLTIAVRKGKSSRQEWLAKVVAIIEGFGFKPHPTKRQVRPLAGHNGFEVVGISIHVEKGGVVSMRPRRTTLRSARSALVIRDDRGNAVRGGYAQYILGHQGLYKARKTSEGYFPRYRPHETFLRRKDVATLCAPK